MQKMVDRIWLYLFSIPFITQIWARKTSKASKFAESGNIPFKKLEKPLRLCRVALVTTGGIHLREQTPYNMENVEGDASFREIPNSVDEDKIQITHKYYNHTDADKDLNVVFPLQHFRSLAKKGVIGSLSTNHYSFMGHIEGEQTKILLGDSAPEAARRLKKDGVDVAFLTPA